MIESNNRLDALPPRRHKLILGDALELGYAEGTRDGRLRHPCFPGLRRDKQAGDVFRETPDD